MNRKVGILSVLSFFGILLLILLMVIGAVNFLNNFKFLVVLSSVFLTLFSLGCFIHQQELPRIVFVFLLLLLTFPAFISLIGIVDPDYFSSVWEIFLGGSIFQIGTGIFALLGGFIKKGLHKSQRFMVVLNYTIYLLLTFLLISDIIAVMDINIYLILGALSSALSVFLMLTRKRTISL
ncbi:MAG TPA: hypothetical protein VKY37_09000 [Brumimicrobium sp.]|nr:hypothetical protein [Brumimicrobium sp.]